MWYKHGHTNVDLKLTYVHSNYDTQEAVIENEDTVITVYTQRVSTNRYSGCIELLDKHTYRKVSIIHKKERKDETSSRQDIESVLFNELKDFNTLGFNLLTPDLTIRNVNIIERL